MPDVDRVLIFSRMYCLRRQIIDGIAHARQDVGIRFVVTCMAHYSVNLFPGPYLVFIAIDTIIANSRFFDNDLKQVPKQSLTVGVGTINDAREVLRS